MAVHRKPRKPPGERPMRPSDDGGTVVPLGVTGAGDDLAAAAQIIADDARRRAAAWARTGAVVASIRVEQQGEQSVTIIADAGAAYPAETRNRHPLFGNRDHWYGPPGEPFLRPAAFAKADAAIRRYAHKIDRMARAAGWGEDQA
jgi:hypothetical protein